MDISISSCMFIHYIAEEKWCSVTYLNAANHHGTWITGANKDFVKRVDSKDIKFSVKIKDIHKIEINISIHITVFGFENKEKHPLYVSKQF